MIATEVRSEASSATVHELLVDVDAWELWSPHVAALDAPSRRVTQGWVGEPRAFFSPVSTAMVVDDVRTDGGYSWHSVLGPWRLDYENRVEPDGTGSRLRFSAALNGPGAAVIEWLVGPLSARGQRRRMRRLARLAELIERSAR